MVTWPVLLLRQASDSGGTRLLRPSATAHRHGIGHRRRISQLSWPDAAAERCPTLQATSWPWIDQCASACTHAHLLRCADGAAPLTGPVGGWAVGADASTRPVSPSLSFWCPPLSVRGAPHQPGEPYRQAAATGHWHRIPLPRPGGSGAHQLIPCADGCCQGTGAGPSFPESDGGGLALLLKPHAWLSRACSRGES